MKTLSGGNIPESEKRPDFGDSPISNAKYDCSKCLLKKVGCLFKVNTLNCEIAIHRMKKALDENVAETEMEVEQNNAVREFLGNIKNVDEDDED